MVVFSDILMLFTQLLCKGYLMLFKALIYLRTLKINTPYTFVIIQAAVYRTQ